MFKSRKFSFRVWGKQALFTDPITKIGGEKFSYQIPTYEAIKGILRSIYWKPTLVWHIDRIRIMKPIQMQSKSTKPLNWEGGNTLAIYTFLQDVEYQVEAHFSWNEHETELAGDRIKEKHEAIAQRMLDRGGRFDVFLGTRDCQAYVEPCVFGAGEGYYDDTEILAFGLMFHSFAYPTETGQQELWSRFWAAKMEKGIVHFPQVGDENLEKRFVRNMLTENLFKIGENVKSAEDEAKELGL